MPVGPRTDSVAIGSLVTGILALVCSFGCLGIILGPAAAVMGFIARGRVASSLGTLGGGTMATVGLVLGVVGFLASIGWLAAILLSGHSYPSSSFSN